MDLEVAGRDVMYCRVDYTFMVALDDDTTITVESDFTYRSADGTEHAVSPDDDPASCGPALVTSRLVARRGTAFEDGRLELEFDDGSIILAPGGEGYESWNIAKENGLKVVSIPGGELAVWSPAPTTREDPPQVQLRGF